MNKTHSNKLGGSKVERRLMCPASYREEENAPPEKPSEYADEGSMLHAVMELLEVNDVWTIKKAQPLLNEALGQDFGYPNHPLTDEHIVTKIEPALKAYWQIHREYKLVDWFVEQPISMESIIPGAFGTADFFAIDEARAIHCLDYKFGDGIPVAAEGNLGCGFYVGCILHDDDPEVQEVFADPLNGQVFIHIIQPRRGFDGPVLDTWETSIDWVEDLIDTCEQAMIEAEKPDAQYKVGEWCGWCRAKSTCPARKQVVVDAVQKDPHGMTAVELGRNLEIAEQAIKWGQDMFSFAQAQAEQGACPIGWKLVQKRSVRQWKNPAEAEAILKHARVRAGQMYDKKLKSPTQIEKVNKKLYSNKLADLVESHSSGVTLVRDSDKRPAVTGSMELLANAIKTEQ